MDLIDTFLCLIDAHGLSQRTVCKAIGYTSPNQLTQLLKRQVSEELMADFGARLLSGADMLCFSPDEQQTLRDCMADIGLSSDKPWFQPWCVRLSHSPIQTVCSTQGS